MAINPTMGMPLATRSTQPVMGRLGGMGGLRPLPAVTQPRQIQPTMGRPAATLPAGRATGGRQFMGRGFSSRGRARMGRRFGRMGGR